MRLLSFLAVLLLLYTSNAHAESPQDTRAACEKNDGVWTKFEDLYPEGTLSGDDIGRYICRIRTREEGSSCTSQKQCRGQCLAPEGTKAGAEAVGVCAEFMWLSVFERNRTIIGGRVVYPEYSMEMTDRKKRLLAELYRNLEKWKSAELVSYSFTAENENCFCFFAQYYGPVETFVNDRKVSKVVYLGKARDGYKPGDEITSPTSLGQTILAFFKYTEEHIEKATGNALIEVTYDPTFGFPTLIKFDRPDYADDQSSVVIYDFKPM